MNRHIKITGIAFSLLLASAMYAQSTQPSRPPRPQQEKTQINKLDLNTASEQELNNLPGISPATAKKIVAGRPYSSVSDLSRAGVSEQQIEQISPMVTVSNST